MSDRKLNIAISCYPTFGGSGIIATEIGMAMAKRGHTVHFISYSVPHRLNRFSANVYFHEVETLDYPVFANPHYSLALASKIVDVATYQGLDLLHVHYAVPHATSAYLAKQIMEDKELKVITTLHGTDITLVGKNRTYLPITRFSIMQSDAVSAPSKFLRYATYDKLNVPSNVDIEIIPNFIDTVEYENKDPEELRKNGQCRACDIIEDFDPSHRILTHVSNFRPVKRVLDVIKIFALVQEKVPSYLFLVGDGPERPPAEALVREMELGDKVYFLGNQDSTSGILQSSTLFLLPSQSESFGLAALEAMSCGVPVIASNAEGIPEVVIDGEVGYLSDVGDVEDMAKNAIRLLLNADLYKRMSQEARSRAHSQYQKEKIIDAYEALYCRVLG